MSRAVAWLEDLAKRFRAPATTPEGIDLLAQLLFVALTGGLSLRAALAHAVPHLDRPLANEVRWLLRQSQRDGLGAALAARHGTGHELYTVLARAHITGAPLADAVAAFISQERQARRTVATERARKLPVKLIVPLALLILPGFVLLTVGPSLVSSLGRVLGPLAAFP